MTVLVILTVIVIVALIAGLAVYLYWAGTLLDRIGAKLEGAADIVRGIVADAELIGPGVDHINRTGGVVAGALPLLYGMAEGIVAGVTPGSRPRPRCPSRPGPPPAPAAPACCTRSATRRGTNSAGAGGGLTLDCRDRVPAAVGNPQVAAVERDRGRVVESVVAAADDADE